MVAESTPPGTVRARLSRSDAGWYLVGLLVLAVLAWVGYRYVGWLVFGLFTYYVGRPIARRLERHVPSRSLAAGLTLVFIIVPVLVFIAAFLGVALGQALDLLSAEAVAAVVDRLPLATTGLPTDPIDVIVVILQDPELSSVLGQFGVVVGSFAATLFNVFLALIFAFFMLVEDRSLAGWFAENVLGPGSRSVAYLRGVDRGLTSVYFGYTLTIFVVIVLAAIIYTLFNLVAPEPLRIPSAMLLAVVTGVFTLIPLVGRSIVYVLIVALLSVQTLPDRLALLWVPVVFFVLMVLVFDNVVRTYIRPYLSGKAYHMGLVMAAYLLGPVLFGWYGIFMGPLLMVLVVQFVVGVLPGLAGVTDENGDVSRPQSDAERPVDERTGPEPASQVDSEETPSG